MLKKNPCFLNDDQGHKVMQGSGFLSASVYFTPMLNKSNYLIRTQARDVFFWSYVYFASKPVYQTLQKPGIAPKIIKLDLFVDYYYCKD